MKSPIEVIAEQCKSLREFVDDPNFPDLMGALLDELSSTDKDATGSLIQLGEVKGIRRVTRRLRELSKPQPQEQPDAKRAPVDPDLED